MKNLLALLVLFALAPGGTTGMVLTRDSFSNGVPGSDYGSAPTWCYHEDSFHMRVWTGTLNAGESFTVPVRFCTTEESPTSGPGPEGVRYAVSFYDRQSVALGITFPDGTSRSAWSRTDAPQGWQGAWGCVVPTMYEATGRYISNVAPGTYVVTLTNTGTRAISSKQALSLEIRVDFITVNFQQTLCPAEDRRLV